MALIVSEVHKAYRAVPVLRGATVTLNSGIVALMGANGAGKSTLLRILATLAPADAGVITFDGLRVGVHNHALRRQIGYLPQEFIMPETLTPRRCLTYLAGLRGGNVAAALAQFTVTPFADQPFGTLSGGQIRRVGVAQAFLGTPRLLLLDELTRGLDIIECEVVFRRLRQVQRHTLILFSTHIREEAERIADQILVLEAGKLTLVGDAKHNGRDQL